MAQEQAPHTNPNGEEIAGQAAEIAKGLVNPDVAGDAAGRFDTGGKSFGETMAEMDQQAGGEGQRLDDNGNAIQGVNNSAELTHPSMKEDWKDFDDVAGAAAQQLLDQQGRDVAAEDGDFTKMKDFDDAAGAAANELLNANPPAELTHTTVKVESDPIPDAGKGEVWSTNPDGTPGPIISENEHSNGDPTVQNPLPNSGLNMPPQTPMVAKPDGTPPTAQ